MDDLADVVEAVVDSEEIADPEELIEDFVESPLLIALALAAALAAVVTVLLIAATLLFLLFAVGPVVLVGVLAMLFLFLTVLAVGGFIYFRTDIPSDIQQKIDSALEQSDDTPRANSELTEQEAIERLKAQYASGELDDYELEVALEDVLTSEQPERVVDRTRSR